MFTLEPEHKKYFHKFGVNRGSGMDWRRESLRPLARCTICVMRYGDAGKTDSLVVETRHGVNYLCCRAHQRKNYAK